MARFKFRGGVFEISEDFKIVWGLFFEKMTTRNFVGAIITSEEVFFIVSKSAGQDRTTDVLEKTNDKTEVVDGGEAIIEAFFCGVFGFPEGAERTSGVAGETGGAVATKIERSGRVFELAEVDFSVKSIDTAVASFAGRSNAVEGIGAVLDADKDVVGTREAEEMTRF